MDRGVRLSRSPVNVLGGCCGTDHRNVREICKVVAGSLRRDRRIAMRTNH
jgi:hypothetical protein